MQYSTPAHALSSICATSFQIKSLIAYVERITANPRQIKEDLREWLEEPEMAAFPSLAFTDEKWDRWQRQVSLNNTGKA